MRKDASELTREPMSGSGNIFATGLLTGGGLGPVVDGEVVPRVRREAPVRDVMYK